MGDWPTNVTLGSIEKCIDMWIDLGDYRECDAEMQIQGLQRDVRAKTFKKKRQYSSLQEVPEQANLPSRHDCPKL